jgi:hypothetical protein
MSSQVVFFPSYLPTKSPYAPIFSHIRDIFPVQSHFSSFDHQDNICQPAKIKTLLALLFVQSPVTLFLLGLNIPYYQHLQPMFFFPQYEISSFTPT